MEKIKVNWISVKSPPPIKEEVYWVCDKNGYTKLYFDLGGFCDFINEKKVYYKTGTHWAEIASPSNKPK